MLRLVARGNAIIAELLRLADFIPAIFAQEHPKVRTGCWCLSTCM
jgi:hypothetical protein